MKLNKVPGILAVVALMAAPCLRAQQQQPQPSQPDQSTSVPDTSVAPLPPLPTGNQPPAGGNSDASPAARGLFVGPAVVDQNGVLLQPDDHVPSSPEATGLGSPLGRHQTFDPSVRFSESLSSGLVGSQLQSITSVGASLNFDQQWERYRLTLLYSGAENLYRPNGNLDVSYHNATFSQEIRGDRIVVRLRDDVIVAPGASFSGLYSGTTGLAGSSVPIPGTEPSLQNNQTIQTGLARSWSNTSLGELDYSISPRSSITGNATYGLVEFLANGFFNSYRAGGGAGYNFSIDGKNTISVLYNYVVTGYRGAPNMLVAQMLEAAYSRKITGRLAFQISAGPELLNLQNYGASSGDRWSWTLTTGLTYAINGRTSVQATYFRQQTPGSGVFLGAESSVFTGGLSYQLARTWYASVNGGYARNSNLAPAPGASNLYNNYFAGGGVTHSFTHAVSLGLNYGYQRQGSSAGTCTVVLCNLAVPSYSIGTVTLDWHPLADRNTRSAF